MNSSNWAGNYQFTARQVHVPRRLEEVQELVAAAHRIKAVGSRHSFNDIADSPGDQLSLEALPAQLDIDRERHTVTVSGGSRYGDFIEQLNGEGFAIHNLASLPHISVAGAIATATHGSGVTNGNLASAVAGLELVTASGEVLRVERGAEDFEGMVVALGALGIVTRVTLDIQPCFQVRQDVYDTLPWDSVTGNFDAITSAAYSVSLFTSWGEEGVTQAWLKSRMDAEATFGPAFFGGVYARQARHPLPGVSPVSTRSRSVCPGRGGTDSRTSNWTSPPATATRCKPNTCCPATTRWRRSTRCARSARASPRTCSSPRSAHRGGGRPLAEHRATTGTVSGSTSPGRSIQKPLPPSCRTLTRRSHRWAGGRTGARCTSPTPAGSRRCIRSCPRSGAWPRNSTRSTSSATTT